MKGVKSVSINFFHENWPALKEQIKREWIDFTEEDLSEVNGSLERLVQAVQKKYNYTWEQAQQETANLIDLLSHR
ncbi:MAG: hypothetical protein GYA17_13605 [Chloroflexi bacterium]|nr:hypothetical protein [Chloroflexota bacterium]